MRFIRWLPPRLTAGACHLCAGEPGRQPLSAAEHQIDVGPVVSPTTGAIWYDACLRVSLLRQPNQHIATFRVGDMYYQYDASRGLAAGLPLGPALSALLRSAPLGLSPLISSSTCAAGQSRGGSGISCQRLFRSASARVRRPRRFHCHQASKTIIAIEETEPI